MFEACSGKIVKHVLPLVLLQSPVQSVFQGYLSDSACKLPRTRHQSLKDDLHHLCGDDSWAKIIIVETRCIEKYFEALPDQQNLVLLSLGMMGPSLDLTDQ